MKFYHRSAPFLNSKNFTVELVTMLTDLVGNLSALFDSGISFEDNIDAVQVSFSSNGTPDTEDAVTHTLKRAPVGFIVVSQNKAGSVYASGTAFSSTQLFLKTNVASVAVKLLVF